MKLKTRTHITHTLTTDAGVDVDLTFEPVCDPLVHETADTVIVAYLVHDSDCENPMTSNDGEGVLHMLSHKLTLRINYEICAALGLDSEGTPDIDRLFDCAPTVGVDGIQYSKTTLRNLAADEFLAGFDANENRKQIWVEYTWGDDLVEGQKYPIDLVALHQNLMEDNGLFCEEIETAAVNLYAKHWRAIAGPFVVPVASYNEGRVGVTTWDGDHLDLPDGVWVACAGAEENIETSALPEGAEIAWQSNTSRGPAPAGHSVVFSYQGRYKLEFSTWSDVLAHIRKAYGEPSQPNIAAGAVKYATGVLESYSAWAEGDCFGCTVELFERNEDGTWDEAKGSRENGCWGFVGEAWAKEALRTEFFEPAVAALQVPA